MDSAKALFNPSFGFGQDMMHFKSLTSIILPSRQPIFLQRAWFVSEGPIAPSPLRLGISSGQMLSDAEKV